MITSTERDAENQRSFDRLLVALEASQGKLDLLLAVCDDSNIQADVIQRYESELRQQQICCYQTFVQYRDPSLRFALEKLVSQTVELQHHQKAVVTVLGIDQLIVYRLGGNRSQLEQWFGYLQWTREAFRVFDFPIVLWLTPLIVSRISEEAPDFWSWRGGVFTFTSGKQPKFMVGANSQVVKYQTPELDRAEIRELLQKIEALEQQQNLDQQELVTVYEQLGELYALRVQSAQERQFAILVFKRIIQLLRKLNLTKELADNLVLLGNLYFELKNDVKPALEAYNEAMGIYREVGDRLGEANTLLEIGDVLQFLKQSQEALQRYETAMGIYREVGDRLGEANTLQAIGDVLQFLKQSQEALQRYETAMGIYREVGDRLGEANTLKAIGDVLQFLDQRQEALQRYETAMGIYREVGDRLGEANTLQAIGDVLQFLKQSQEALQRYETAMGIYREVGDRLGEANTLKAIGDVLQFLDQRQEALQRYETAMGIYREVGARLGEANTLKEIGDVLQFLDQRQEALQRYETAMGIYREVGARLGEANTLLEMSRLVDDPLNSINDVLAAQAIFISIGDLYSQGRTLLSFLIPLQAQLEDHEGIQRSLDLATLISKKINFEPFCEYADQIRAELYPTTPT